MRSVGKTINEPALSLSLKNSSCFWNLFHALYYLSPYSPIRVDLSICLRLTTLLAQLDLNHTKNTAYFSTLDTGLKQTIHYRTEILGDIFRIDIPKIITSISVIRLFKRQQLPTRMCFLT